MHNLEKHSAILENAAGLVRRRRIYIRSHNKVAALGYVYTLGKETSRSPKHCKSQNATSVEFLEVQDTFVYGWVS